jgi:hypothetical protein
VAPQANAVAPPRSGATPWVDRYKKRERPCSAHLPRRAGIAGGGGPSPTCRPSCGVRLCQVDALSGSRGGRQARLHGEWRCAVRRHSRCSRRNPDIGRGRLLGRPVEESEHFHRERHHQCAVLFGRDICNCLEKSQLQRAWCPRERHAAPRTAALERAMGCAGLVTTGAATRPAPSACLPEASDEGKARRSRRQKSPQGRCCGSAADRLTARVSALTFERSGLAIPLPAGPFLLQRG